MDNVFLCLKDSKDGSLYQKWIYDVSYLTQLLKDGWKVYRATGFREVTDVVVELKVSREDAWSQSPKSSESDN